MIGPRVDSPDDDMIARLEAQLSQGKPATAQWSRPPEDSAVLGKIALEWFHSSQTALDLDALRDRAWPPTTRSVGLFSRSLKWNEATKAALAARGYSQFSGR